MAKSHYPTAHQIEDMFQWRADASTHDKFDAIIDDHLDAKMMGHDHHLAGEYKGKPAWIEGNRSHFLEMIDRSKPFKLEIVHVIGGGDSPWASVEMKTTAKAVSGMCI